MLCPCSQWWGGRLGTALAGLRPWPLDAVVQFRQVLAKLGRASGGRLASKDSLPLHFAPLSIFLPPATQSTSLLYYSCSTSNETNPPLSPSPELLPFFIFPHYSWEAGCYLTYIANFASPKLGKRFKLHPPSNDTHLPKEFWRQLSIPHGSRAYPSYGGESKSDDRRLPTRAGRMGSIRRRGRWRWWGAGSN